MLNFLKLILQTKLDKCVHKINETFCRRLKKPFVKNYILPGLLVDFLLKGGCRRPGGATVSTHARVYCRVLVIPLNKRFSNPQPTCHLSTCPHVNMSRCLELGTILNFITNIPLLFVWLRSLKCYLK